MKRLVAAVLSWAVVMEFAALAADPAYVAEIQKWRDARETSLRADNGWLTLAGRFALKPGVNTFGTAKDNDIVFPPELKGPTTDRLGKLLIDPAAKTVTLQLPGGVSWESAGKPFSGERILGTATDKRDWVSRGRISMHIIERGGRYFLRLADNESLVRKNFPGRIWYPVDEAYKIEATFIPYPAGKTLPIVNVIDEISNEPNPGYAQFKLAGVTHKLDAIAEGDSLFFVFRDGTAGDTTYRPARFLLVETRPKDNETFTLDFNKAYNPPCAFAEFTTCPLPPMQNILKTRIEAGEKFRKK